MRVAFRSPIGVLRRRRQEELLLRSALLQGESARRAWRELRPSLDLDRLPAALASLLPLVYRNAAVLDRDDPETPRLKGLYRRTWYANEALFHRLASVLRLFAQAGIDTLVLRDAPLVVRYYKDSGLRPVAAVELLVHTEQATAAVALLEDARFSRRGHGTEFTDGRRSEPDVRWRVVSDFLPEASSSTEDCWESAVAITIGGAPARALNAADQFLQLCVEGPGFGSTARWVADCMMILRAAGPKLDWGRLVDQGEKRRAILPVAATLALLADSLEAPVPRDIVTYQMRMRPERREVLAFWLSRLRGRLPRDLAQYTRLSAQWSLPHAVLRLPRFLQDRWELDHAWQIPVALGRKGLTRIWRRMAAARPADRRPGGRAL